MMLEKKNSHFVRVPCWWESLWNNISTSVCEIFMGGQTHFNLSHTGKGKTNTRPWNPCDLDPLGCLPLYTILVPKYSTVQSNSNNILVDYRICRLYIVLHSVCAFTCSKMSFLFSHKVFPHGLLQTFVKAVFTEFSSAPTIFHVDFDQIKCLHAFRRKLYCQQLQKINYMFAKQSAALGLHKSCPRVLLRVCLYWCF